MKVILSVLITLFLYPSFSQVIDTRIYYNAEWSITTPNGLRYYRDCQFDTVRQVFTGPFSDFIIGDIQLTEGNYSSEGLLDGDVTYLRDGKPVKISTFENGKMVRMQQFESFGDNDEVELTSDIQIDGDDFYVQTFFDSLGNQLIYEGSGLWYHKQPGNTIIEGRFNEGEKEGAWRYRTSSGIIILVETYKKGKMKSAELYSAEGVENLPKSSFTSVLFKDRIFDKVNSLEFDIYASRSDYPFLRALPVISIANYSNDKELEKRGDYTPAQYPGDMQGLYMLIAQNLQYPEKERRNGVSGKVYVGFQVNEDGSFQDMQVVKGLTENCNKEALRVLTKMARWEPAKLDGKPVASRKLIPITFRLSNR